LLRDSVTREFYLDIGNPPSFMMVGQSLTMQLSSGATDFGSLASNNTGWRVELTKPDTSAVDLGLMSDWMTIGGVVFKWNMTVPGSNLLQVR
jgi:hypothetical protein